MDVPLDLTPAQEMLRREIFAPFFEEKSLASERNVHFNVRQWFATKAVPLLYDNPFVVGQFILLCSMWDCIDLRDMCSEWLLSTVESWNRDGKLPVNQEIRQKQLAETEFIKRTTCASYARRPSPVPEDGAATAESENFASQGAHGPATAAVVSGPSHNIAKSRSKRKSGPLVTSSHKSNLKHKALENAFAARKKIGATIPEIGRAHV